MFGIKTRKDKRIEELEHYNAKCKADIAAYNRVITGMITGNVVACDWCEEKDECQLEAKGKGCGEWWLAFTHPAVKEDKADETNGSEEVPIVGSTGGE